ncbi:DMT family transporter [Paraconexibacter antarcticus]|uniref:DMT family transporter n=1 Tax=Paraconexibacter antarcticus TaxID=2949664 RepID=A0ABY5DY73_9ACTN|nr:DMT family transporter [Paraconexibacter antarcticus]UTI66475.1 DMT family transporter [Paraconexibacter antarcticus]
MERRAWVFMGMLAATWGASYLFIKVGLRDLDAAQVVCVRTALAALVLAPVALRSGALPALRERKGSVVLIAAVQVIAPFLLISVGESHIDTALAGILVASAPIWTALLATRFDDAERSHGWGTVGVLVGILGVALLFGVDLSGDATALLAGAGILVAGLGYAAGGMLIKRRMAGVPPAGVAASTMTVSALVTLPLALIHPPTSLGLDAAASMLALGALGTGVAFLLFYTLIAELGPARASLVAYIAPGFAVVYGAVLLGEDITVGTVGGLVLILLGSWMGAEGRAPWQRRVSRTAPSRSSAPEPVPSR